MASKSLTNIIFCPVTPRSIYFCFLQNACVSMCIDGEEFASSQFDEPFFCVGCELEFPLIVVQD